MPQFSFALTTLGDVREMGVVQSESFSDAITAIEEHAAPKQGDRLEIGVAGFPPARYECVPGFRGSNAWRPSGLLAA